MQTHLTFSNADASASFVCRFEGLQGLNHATIFGNHFSAKLSVAMAEAFFLTRVEMGNGDFSHIPFPDYWAEGVTHC